MTSRPFSIFVFCKSYEEELYIIRRRACTTLILIYSVSHRNIQFESLPSLLVFHGEYEWKIHEKNTQGLIIKKERNFFEVLHNYDLDSLPVV